MHAYMHMSTHTHSHTIFNSKKLYGENYNQEEGRDHWEWVQTRGLSEVSLRNYLKKDMTKVKEGAMQIPG